MEQRLLSQGIETMEQLWQLDIDQMTQLWGGVLGTRFWLKLRGSDFDERESPTRSISHQHVLPPELRTREQACAVGKKLLHKAAVACVRPNSADQRHGHLCPVLKETKLERERSQRLLAAL